MLKHKPNPQTHLQPINWAEPVERAELLMRVGVEEYRRQQAEHFKATIVRPATDTAPAIRIVQTSFGLLYAVDGTGIAYKTLREAIDHAERGASKC
jgi:hypothetical protein